MHQSSSVAKAKSYFKDALEKGDYYLSDAQEMKGFFHGKLADKLGIQGEVTRDVFYNLCENVNPQTGNSLTPKTKENRTVYYDVTFSVPKSVSIVHAFSKDDHILNAFEDSVQQTMKEIETDIETRVRRDGQYLDRKADGLVYATFVHQTSRPVDDHAPDMHLHAHNVIVNCTWDNEEQRYKAGKFLEIKRNMPYYQELFYKHMSDRLMELGYDIRPNRKSFEIAGVPQRVIDNFSKRTAQVNRIAKEKGITDEQSLSELGARTRSQKQKGLTMSELRENWRQQIRGLGIDDRSEGAALVRHKNARLGKHISAQQCIAHSIEHNFERSSVVRSRRILQTALKHGIGSQFISVEDIKREFAGDKRIIEVEEGSQKLCTTKAVLSEEKHMVQLARTGLGTMKPLYEKCPELPLDGQQADAVSHVLTSTSQLSVIRGGAGAGKTTIMPILEANIKKAGKEMFIFAPSSEASRGVLRQEGFKSATTVAMLLEDKAMHEKIRGQVVVIDEAGLLGTEDTRDLLLLTQKQTARLLLVGDPKQHAAVKRGDALRILNKVAGIKPAEVTKIYRQKTEQYKKAVEDLSEFKVKSGFEKLDAIGFIRESKAGDADQELVTEYVAALKAGKSALVISPTHDNGKKLTGNIRAELKKSGLLGKKEIEVTRYENLNLTIAEKQDVRNFSTGQIIQFNLPAKGILRGSVWTVDHVQNDRVTIIDEKQRKTDLPMHTPNRYDLMQKTSIPIAKGDKVRLTRNGFDHDKERLNSGQMMEVVAIGTNGEMKLKNPVSKCTYRLGKDFGHIAHAHCITSHASQGKTVDQVFISQPSETFGAASAKQFYVSASRGREKAIFYTDDKEGLLKRVSEIGDRQSAIELVSKDYFPADHIRLRERMEYDQSNDKATLKSQERRERRNIKERDYEPGV